MDCYVTFIQQISSKNYVPKLAFMVFLTVFNKNS